MDIIFVGSVDGFLCVNKVWSSCIRGTMVFNPVNIRGLQMDGMTHKTKVMGTSGFNLGFLNDITFLLVGLFFLCNFYFSPLQIFPVWFWAYKK